MTRDLDTIEQALGALTSCIRSGEPFTDQMQTVRDDGVAALARVRAALEAKNEAVSPDTIEQARRYRTIVADPPWAYRTTKPAARWHRFTTAESHYATMTNREIAALPVEGLAEEQAHLYLWVTNPRLYAGRADDGVGPREIVQAWGFQYQTLITWVKQGTLGMGWYFRGDTEHVIFATRGKLGIAAEKRERNVIVAPKGRHSEKPDAFMDMVERVSPGPYLELFSRRQRLGWDTWGDEALGHVELTA